MWQFQPQNESKVQQLLNEMAKNPQLDNKWHIFLSKSDNSTSNDSVTSIDGRPDRSKRSGDVRAVAGGVGRDECREPTRDGALTGLRALLENDFVTNIDSITKLCTENDIFWEYLADNLCEQNVDMLIKHISNGSAFCKDALSGFYENFFGRLLVRKYSRSTLEAILAVHRNNPADFSNCLFPVMCNREGVPADVLMDFCKSISDADKTKTLEMISKMKHDTEILSKHLPSILILYQSSEKLNSIQNYVLDILLMYGETFEKDKNFGKLLLTYIQNLKRYPKNCSEIEKVISEHGSIFKRPCLTALLNLQKINL